MRLTDEQWELIEPFIPDPQQRVDRRGRPPGDKRAILEGILWFLNSRARRQNLPKDDPSHNSPARWQDLPKDYPSHQTCNRRFLEWVEAEVFAQLVELLTTDSITLGDENLKELLIDANSMERGNRQASPSQRENAKAVTPTEGAQNEASRKSKEAPGRDQQVGVKSETTGRKTRKVPPTRTTKTHSTITQIADLNSFLTEDERRRVHAISNYLIKKLHLSNLVQEARWELCASGLLSIEQVIDLMKSPAIRFFNIQELREKGIPLSGHHAEIKKIRIELANETNTTESSEWLAQEYIQKRYFYQYIEVFVEPPGSTFSTFFFDPIDRVSRFKTGPQYDMKWGQIGMAFYTLANHGKHLKESEIQGRIAQIATHYESSSEQAPHCSALDWITATVSILVKQSGWTETEALWFLLTDYKPQYHPVRIRMEAHTTKYYSLDQIYIDADSWISPATIRRIYTTLREDVDLRDQRKIDQITCELFEFVTNEISAKDGKRPPWTELADKWIRLHPELGETGYGAKEIADHYDRAAKLLLNRAPYRDTSSLLPSKPATDSAELDNEFNLIGFGPNGENLRIVIENLKELQNRKHIGDPSYE